MTIKHHPDCDVYQATCAKETIETFGLDDEKPNPDEYSCLSDCADLNLRDINVYSGQYFADEDYPDTIAVITGYPRKLDPEGNVTTDVYGDPLFIFHVELDEVLYPEDMWYIETEIDLPWWAKHLMEEADNA